MLWLCSIHLLGSRRAGGTRTAAELVLPVVIALAPALGMITGLYRAIAHARLLGQSQDEPALEAYIAVMWGILFLLAVALGWLTYLHFDRLSAFTAGKFKLRYTSLALLVLVAMSLAAMYGDSMSPAHMGVVGLIFTCAILLVYILSAFASHYRARGVPITLIVLAFAVTIAYFGLNDNHQVSAKILTSPAPILEPSFLEWAQHRGDREQFASERKPYPIYIVAAEGGGLYAAYHVATALSRLQDACPNFAQHVFGISSVSGGSLGAAVFAAAAKDMTANGPWQACAAIKHDGAMQRRVRRYFAWDFLSPVVAGLLFPDLLQRFVPYPIQATDRSRALERSFATAWRSASGNEPDAPNPFDLPLDQLWDTAGSVPALFLNTTSVATGARVTLSALGFDATPTALHISQAFCIGYPPQVAIALSSAVSLSARAPWLTPAGWIKREADWNKGTNIRCLAPEQTRGDRLYLADGGYFENSGLETALDLAARLRKVASTDQKLFPFGAEIRIIMVFANDEFLMRWSGADSDLLVRGAGELLEPVETLLMTRIARTRAVHSRAIAFDDANFQSGRYFDRTHKYVLPCSRLRGGDDSVHQVVLEASRFGLPLGWRLSQRALDHIALESNPETDLAFAIISAELRGADTLALKQQFSTCISDNPR